MAKKLLFILNPAAGKTQSREPLFDALGVLSDAGYLLRIRTTAGRGHAEDIVRWRVRNTTPWSAAAATAR